MLGEFKSRFLSGKKIFLFIGLFCGLLLGNNRLTAQGCHGGSGMSGGHQHEEKSDDKTTEKKSKSKKSSSVVYICPMHPDVISDKPGKCPECGMKLKKKKAQKNSKLNTAK